jgi:hypothetical protein
MISKCRLADPVSGSHSCDLNPVKVEVSERQNGLAPAPVDKSKYRAGRAFLALHLSSLRAVKRAFGVLMLTERVLAR